MKLNPNDIAHQEFKRIMRGFDPDEVQAFLEVVAENYKELMDEVKLLNQKIKANQDETQYLRLRIQSLEKNINEYKQEMAKVEKLVDARVDADLIVEQAKAEAEKIRQEAQKHGETVSEEVSFLAMQKTKVAAHLREYLKSQMALLEIVAENKAGVQAMSKNPAPEKVELPVEKPSHSGKAPEVVEGGIGQFVQGAALDDVPQEVADAMNEPGDVDPDHPHEKKKKAIEELDKLTHNATGIFKKSDFDKMLGKDAEKKSQDMIDQMHQELHKKKPENE